MVRRPPDYCPSCGSALSPVDPPTQFRCPDCEEPVFYGPTANCRAVVLDGDRVLLVEIADEARIDDGNAPDSEWMTPGGHYEDGEQPHETAARELREETGLGVDPGDLELFDAVVRQVVEGVHSTVLLYAVDRAATTGELRAGDDAADARFWSPDELAAADATYRDLYAEPPEYRSLSGLLDRAREGIGSGSRP